MAAGAYKPALWPCTGPLIYQRRGRDFILYSVGRDFTDDGGLPSRERWGKDGDKIFWPVAKTEAAGN